MARAKRHYIPGLVWHITHRCHKQEFLLKFAKDRKRWLQWLFESKGRYGLTILDYIVTSNHIHLLVVDDKDRLTIPKSMQLVAGRQAQEYNNRKKRKGAYWEDRYHATAIEDGKHLLQCLIYIDLNMVRTGVVSHPSQWPDSGFNEIQTPRRKCILINYEKLAELSGCSSYESLQELHLNLINDALQKDKNKRQSYWSQSIAVGGKDFIERTKNQLGAKAVGRKTKSLDDGFELREKIPLYNNVFDTEKSDIDHKNTCKWNIFDTISAC